MVYPFINRVAERYPGLELGMCRLALPTGKQDEEAFRHCDKLLVLAKYPNVAVKGSALPAYTSDNYPYLRRVYDAFGPRHMFWGTIFHGYHVATSGPSRFFW